MPASALSLEKIYGGMAKGCTYDQAANYRIIKAYVDEYAVGPRLARPEGGKRLTPFLGKARLHRQGESYTLTIPVAGATLYGIPVSQLAPYRGINADIAGVAIIFPVPVSEARARLRRAGIELVAHDHGWGDIKPVLRPARHGSHTELICDLSM